MWLRSRGHRNRACRSNLRSQHRVDRDDRARGESKDIVGVRRPNEDALAGGGRDGERQSTTAAYEMKGPDAWVSYGSSFVSRAAQPPSVRKVHRMKRVLSRVRPSVLAEP